MMSGASAGRAASSSDLNSSQFSCLLARLRFHAHEMPLASQLLAVQVELEVPFLVAERGIEIGGPGALVPDHDGAAAVLAFGDDALEAAIVERMVLGQHGQPFLAGDQARPLRHRPALQHAVELEPEVVMQAPRRVLLDDIGVAGRRSLAARRLRRLGEVALGVIGVEGLGHGGKVGKVGKAVIPSAAPALSEVEGSDLSIASKAPRFG